MQYGIQAIVIVLSLSFGVAQQTTALFAVLHWLFFIWHFVHWAEAVWNTQWDAPPVCVFIFGFEFFDKDLPGGPGPWYSRNSRQTNMMFQSCLLHVMFEEVISYHYIIFGYIQSLKLRIQ